jgi:hypothetical protein
MSITRGKGKSKIQIIGKRKGKRENQKQGGYRQLILPFLFEGERDE